MIATNRFAVHTIDFERSLSLPFWIEEGWPRYLVFADKVQAAFMPNPSPSPATESEPT